jgi:hypothetical protein
MCYSVYLATDSKEDLEKYNDNQVFFEKIEKGDEITLLLKNENKWHIATGKAGCCSCGLRHLMRESLSLGFSKPEDWFHEKKADLQSTKKIYNIICKLIADGYKVESLDVWTEPKPEDIITKDIEIKNISDDEFRFFEGYLFRFR